jgi:hypothetical protein
MEEIKTDQWVITCHSKWSLLCLMFWWNCPCGSQGHPEWYRETSVSSTVQYFWLAHTWKSHKSALFINRVLLPIFHFFFAFFLFTSSLVLYLCLFFHVYFLLIPSCFQCSHPYVCTFILDGTCQPLLKAVVHFSAYYSEGYEPDSSLLLTTLYLTHAHRFSGYIKGREFLFTFFFRHCRPRWNLASSSILEAFLG